MKLFIFFICYVFVLFQGYIIWTFFFVMKEYGGVSLPPMIFDIKQGDKVYMNVTNGVWIGYLPGQKSLQQLESEMSCSTTFGSARVLVSPSSSNCPEAIFLRILLIIFPLLVFGSPGAQWILSGAANAPI
ncbi:hypothetical protein F8388_010194 [Cannabis sativa]|uniref:Uncharacterized protein n=1 Tax=Cannabis sativa TaxID=3483 RepID=A0A7J6GS92_CANSA|nr:hypothetical protein F8388_010194 [Cannabis sativa]